MNGSRQLSRCDLKGPHQRRGASPVKVYLLETPAKTEEEEDEDCDDEGVCRRVLTFDRRQETAGVARFLATRLEGGF
jgi:hypothetical protein